MYYNKNTKTIISSLPHQHIFVASSKLEDSPIFNGCSTAEFHLWDSKYHIAEGFLPFEEIKPQFNSDIETIIPQEIIVSKDKNSASRKWTVVPKTEEQLAAETASAWASIKAERNRLLAQSDWTQLADVASSPAWVIYRQTLRDITDIFSSPELVVWPDKPL